MLQDVLVDPLEALRVFNRHEEFLSQVFKWLVRWQIQAVKTGKKGNNIWQKALSFATESLDEEIINDRRVCVNKTKKKTS